MFLKNHCGPIVIVLVLLQHWTESVDSTFGLSTTTRRWSMEVTLNQSLTTETPILEELEAGEDEEINLGKEEEEGDEQGTLSEEEEESAIIVNNGTELETELETVSENNKMPFSFYHGHTNNRTRKWKKKQGNGKRNNVSSAQVVNNVFKDSRDTAEGEGYRKYFMPTAAFFFLVWGCITLLRKFYKCYRTEYGKEDNLYY